MISVQKYKCNNCDGLECETSICPNCGNRTELIGTEIFYCEKCKCPVFFDTCSACGSKCKKISTDIRPVFAKERLLIEVLLGKPFEFANHSVWCGWANNYIVDGKKQKVSFANLKKTNPDDVISLLEKFASKNKTFVDHDFDNPFIKKFVRCNSYRLNTITTEAVNYIQNISKPFDMGSMFISFSGGKDSTVTSDLVMKALDTEKIIHIYGDTTLEYPESGLYLKEFKKIHPFTPVLIAKNLDQDFSNLCEVVGPPSRVMRWCCTVFKTGAITKKIEQTFRDKSRLLSFQGIRRSESVSRSKYDRDSTNSKITKQMVASPIIDWTDFDVWLYLLSNQIPFNNAYREGFSRVGCWCCPNNSSWSEFLSSIYMNTEYNHFHNILYSFAKRVGKPDWKEYIDSGSWKARQGGNGLDYSRNTVISFKPCAFDEMSMNFSLSKPISESLYTLFKPFGLLNFDIGNKRLGEVYVMSKRTGEPFLKLTGRIGMNDLRVTILKIIKPFSYQKDIEECVRNQLTKYQICIGCTYCQSVCKFNALKVQNLKKGSVSNDTILYEIDETKCVGCLECVKHFDGGCYMKKVLRTKKGGE